MKTIVWEKEHFDVLTNKHSIKEELEDNILTDEEMDDFEDERPRLVSNGVGVFMLHDRNPVNRMEFWRGYTNFPISERVLKVINDCPGVELITYLSRYTFVIGVGRLFKFADIRIELENKLCGKHQNEILIKSIPDKDLQEKVTLLKDKISKEGDWTMYIFPNGNITYAVDKGNKEEYNTNVAEILELATLTPMGMCLYGEKQPEQSQLTDT
jgi:hypothetical protein